MGRQDLSLKNYMKNNKVFADLFNYRLFDGKQVIDPKSLHDVDPSEFIMADEVLKKVIEKRRDLLKKAVAIKYDGKCLYCLLGVENQIYVNYKGPFTAAFYDFMRYFQQVIDIADAHDDANDLKGDEHLSSFSKTDRLIPVITLMVLWKGKEWDGPRYLHDLYAGELDEKIKPMLLDYKLNLIEPLKMDETEFAKFVTDLPDVLQFCKYSEDKEAMEAYLRDKLDKNISAKAARAIRLLGNVKMKIKKGAKVVNVCRAIEEMRAESKEEGIAIGEEKGIEKGIAIGEEKGRAEGRAEGRIEGRAEGRTEGKLDGILMSVKTVMKKMQMTVEQAMDFLDVNEGNRAALMKMF